MICLSCEAKQIHLFYFMLEELKLENEIKDRKKTYMNCNGAENSIKKGQRGFKSFFFTFHQG